MSDATCSVRVTQLLADPTRVWQLALDTVEGDTRWGDGPGYVDVAEDMSKNDTPLLGCRST
jgi:hypothetical protein